MRESWRLFLLATVFYPFIKILRYLHRNPRSQNEKRRTRGGKIKIILIMCVRLSSIEEQRWIANLLLDVMVTWTDFVTPSNRWPSINNRKDEATMQEVELGFWRFLLSSARKCLRHGYWLSLSYFQNAFSFKFSALNQRKARLNFPERHILSVAHKEAAFDWKGITESSPHRWDLRVTLFLFWYQRFSVLFVN